MTQVIGDVGAAAQMLKDLPYSNGKVGIIGFCSGGRQAYCSRASSRTSTRRSIAGAGG